jgi:hypothetical protein
MAFLTMEASPCCYVIWKQRLVVRFPCNSLGFFVCSTLSSKGSEPPRKASNLSPEPSPKGAHACSRRWQLTSVAGEAAQACGPSGSQDLALLAEPAE